MRTRVTALLAFCLGVGLATAMAQKSKDSTIVDPDVHKVVFENEHVRVLDGKIAPGWKSSMHSHPPRVLVSVGTGRFRITSPEGKTVVADFYPGMVVWLDATEHSWEMLAGDAHVIAVEVKSAQAPKGN